MFDPFEAPSPPPLHYSPADHDHLSTRDSTPVTTPIAFGVPSRKPTRDKDLEFSTRNSRYSGTNCPSYFDSRFLHHIPADSDLDLFASSSSPPPSSKMTGSAAPIDITTRQTSVSPPGQQASNLTSALQKAGKAERTGSISHPTGVGISVFKAPPPRKDSIGTAAAQWGNGTKPISVSGSNRDKQQRRESLAGSLVGGMSWGGVSVGSWIRDDIIMTGTSPFTTFQSPSFHSSSYLPKLEANFMRDFSCCGVTLPTLHDLLQHYEEAHATKSTQQGHRPSQGDHRAALAAAAIAQQQQGQQQNNQGRLSIDRAFFDMPRKLSQPANHHSDLDTIDDMEMDEPMGDNDSTQMFSPQARDNNQGGFGNSDQKVPHLNLSMLSNHQGFKGSEPGTPVPSSRPFSLQNNPTVSSVNTPTLMANPLQNSQFRNTPDSSGPGTPAELDESMVGPFGELSMQNNPMMQGQQNFARFTGNNDMVDLCIDEPAKRLFSPNGGINNPNAHFKLSGAQYGPDSDIARRIREQQLLAGVPDTTILLPNEEPKPFRCPVIGCEKAYKNQNGLKYHKAHGHNNQQLHDNADGTFSIVNPETSAPYPGTLGMEKEKPYRCEVCGKRYKNLNGLKYHKSHSPPCNPDFQLAAGRNLNFGGGVMQGQNINVAGAGLPGIGEEGLI